MAKTTTVVLTMAKIVVNGISPHVLNETTEAAAPETPEATTAATAAQVVLAMAQITGT